ncbi:MAG: 30S ribosomal protein S6 [Bacillota bacterium]|nr:30S ribosomal protein S6 [Bacillota bacterium]
MVRSYEAMFVLHPKVEDEAVDSLVERFQKVVTDGGGEVLKSEKWGRRKLAYEIEKCTEGFYVVMDFRSESAVAQELERVLKITDEVIRYLLVRLEE